MAPAASEGQRSIRVDFGLVLELSMLLFVTGGSFAAFSLWREGPESHFSYIAVLSVPAAASLLLNVLGIIVPGVFAVGRIAFPLNITLPLVHGALCILVAELSRSAFGITAVPPRLQAALKWGDLRFVFFAALGQFVVLTLLTLLRAGSKPPDATPPSS